MSAKLQICEIFKSLQGETGRVGLPTAFVRLAGCNLDCRWCDTRYAAAVDQQTAAMTVEEVLSRVAAMRTEQVCLTGGEPLLQAGAAELARAIVDAGKSLSVETNGTLSVAVLPRRASVILDVKCPGSGEAGRDLAENFEIVGKTDEVKFVIADRTDYEYARLFCGERDLFDITNVLFGPVDGRVAPRVLAEWMLADELPARFNSGLHRIIWGAQARGR